MPGIYTRKGDDGTTALLYGGRVPKHHPRPEAYGATDEAAAALGVARAHCGDGDAEIAADILSLQDGLYIAGAELAAHSAAADRLENGVTRVTDAMTTVLEQRIDAYMDRTEPQKQFTLPGGTLLSAHLDVARTAVRRAERRVTELAERGELASDSVLRYLNRASDLVFAMARFADEPEPELFAGRRRTSS